MSIDLEKSRRFIAETELPPRPRETVSQDAETAQTIFDTTKDQATVVGSDVVSFVAGVEDVVRAAISDSALLAQLAATKKVPDATDVYGWYDAYFEVLKNLGWVVQDSGFTEYAESGDGFEVHEKILEFATALLGPGATALVVITATLNALKGVKSDNGWLTIFDRETQHAKAGRFQISLVEPSAGGEALVSMIAFGMEADKTVTQVLFFKIKKSHAELRYNSAKMSINQAALTDLGPAIRKKVRDYQAKYIADLSI
jgi:hypothetical protein